MPTSLDILLVEDEPQWAGTAGDVIAALGWRMAHAQTLQAAEEEALRRAFDIVILDRLLVGDEDGLALIARLHRFEVTPMVLVVSQLSGTSDRVLGLEEGADDYLPKPFDASELRARLVALARRAGKWTQYPTVERIGELEVRRNARTVAWRGKVQRVPEQLFDLLWVFVSNRGEVLSRERLWAEVWPDYARLEPQKNTIEVAVGRLRRLIQDLTGRAPIRSVRGQGYVWDEA